ncbi:MAG: hypothetical protein AVDCRST_MAG69-1506, partial [uncultured Solirubrobacteraceae bacterium]
GRPQPPHRRGLPGRPGARAAGAGRPADQPARRAARRQVAMARGGGRRRRRADRPGPGRLPARRVRRESRRVL